MAWRKIAECSGDYLWIDGPKGAEVAVVSREEPSVDAETQALAAVIVHIDPDEWVWFE